MIINMILGRSPRPKNTISTGKNAILGTGYNRYTIGEIKSSNLLIDADNTPMLVPNTNAMPREIMMRYVLYIIFMNNLSVKILKKLTIVFVGDGMIGELTLIYNIYQKNSTIIYA